jgi:type I restriction enzyme S subunit
MYGATVGQVARLRIAAATNQAVCHIKPDETVCNPEYLYWYLRSSKDNLLKQRVGGAQPNISQSIIRDMKVPLPPLGEQERITSILEKADGVRRKREEALKLSDELLRSVFLDMFGDPVTNPKGWEKIPLGEIIKVRSGVGLISKNMAVNGTYPVYGGNGISGYHDQYLFSDRKIALGRVGVYCGVVHYTQPESWITDNALYVEELKKPIEPLYLVEALRIANLNQYAGTSAQPLISGGRIYKVKILYPPAEIQKKFGKFISRQTSVQMNQRLSMSDSDTLFKAFQQRAFSGQL